MWKTLALSLALFGFAAVAWGMDYEEFLKLQSQEPNPSAIVSSCANTEDIPEKIKACTYAIDVLEKLRTASVEMVEHLTAVENGDIADESIDDNDISAAAEWVHTWLRLYSEGLAISYSDRAVASIRSTPDVSGTDPERDCEKALEIARSIGDQDLIKLATTCKSIVNLHK